MKKYLLLLFCFIVGICSSVQSAIFSGKVIDAETKKSLAFVSVIVVKGNRGVQTDIDGKFSINTAATRERFRFQYVGYETLEVELNESDQIVIELKSKENIIAEATVIAGENPAHRIILKALENKDKNNPEKLPSFRYFSYNKFVFTGKQKDSVNFVQDSARSINYRISKLDSTNRDTFEKKRDSVIMQYSKQKRRTDSLFNTQHLFLTETVTQRDFEYPENNKEKIKAVRISGLKNPMFVLIASQFQSFSFYKDYLKVIDKNYLSPISKGSTNKYFFNIEDTLYNNADTVFVISFKPRKGKNFDALKGLLYINTDGFALQNVIAEPAVRGGTFAIKVQQQYEKVNTVWFPTQLNTDLEFITGIAINDRKLIGIGRTYIKDIEINVDQTKTKFDGVVVDFDKKSIKNNSDSLLTKYRIDTLNDLERQTYKVIDSVGKAEKLDEKVKLFSVVSKGYIPWGPVQFDIKKVLTFNDYEGVRFALPVRTSDKFSKYFSVGTYGAWGTKDNKFKYGADVNIPIYLRQDISFSLEYKKDVTESGAVVFRGEKKQLSDNYHTFSVYNMDWIEGMEAKLTIRSQKYFYHTLYANQFKRNVTTPYFFTDGGISMNAFESREFGISTKWAYGENFMRQAEQRISLGTKYPIVWFNIAYGEGLTGNWKSNYMKYDFSVSKTFTIRNAGATTLMAFAGFIDGQVPYPFAYNGRGNKSGSINFASRGYFEAMSMNEFLSSEYTSVFLTHDFGKLLYQKGRFKPGISLSTGAAWGSLNNKNQHTGAFTFKTMEKGYYESGMIVRDIFVLNTNIYNMGLGAGVFYRYGPYKNVSEKDNFAYKLNISISF